MRRRPLFLVAALSAALQTVGCRPHVPPPDLSLDPGELLAQVKAGQARSQRVQGEAKTRIRTARGSGTIRSFAAAERPDRVHLEQLDFFGNPNLVLVTSGGRFWLFDRLKNVLYRGTATPRNLSRLVPIPLSAEDLVAILLGTAPVPEDAAAAGARQDGARLYLRLTQADVIEELWVAAHAVVERADRQVAGGAGPGSFRIDLTGHEERGGAWFPRKVSIDSEPAKVGVDLSWTEVEVNGVLDPRLFAPLAPHGARVVEVGEGAEPG